MSRYNAHIPLNRNDLEVLSWYAAWTPEIHQADWPSRRQWQPGFRYMEDLSNPGWAGHKNSIENSEALASAGPVLNGESPTGKRVIARSYVLPKLLAYGLVEGCLSRACRLTARGRAALLFHGWPCPDVFESHCPEIFDAHSLKPIKGINVHIDIQDETMGRIGPEYKIEHGRPLPDNKTTWGIMLTEYQEDGYRGRGTLTGSTAGLRVTTGNGMYLNGSLREHRQVLSLTVSDAYERQVLDVALSFEQLADLLVSQGDVPVTLNYFVGKDGMAYSRPAPPPVSVSRRMQERISRGTQDLLNRIARIRTAVDGKMGKKLQSEVTGLLDLVERDAKGLGSFSAEQAMEEMSALAESLMTVVADRASFTGGDAPGLLLRSPENPRPVTTPLLIEGEVIED